MTPRTAAVCVSLAVAIFAVLAVVSGFGGPNRCKPSVRLAHASHEFEFECDHEAAKMTIEALECGHLLIRCSCDVDGGVR